MTDPIPQVDSGLANSALAKIAGGAALSDLSKQEQAAIGDLPPQALAAARSKYTAPKGVGSVKEQYSSPGPGAPQPAPAPPLPNAQAAASAMPSLPPMLGQVAAQQNADDTANAAFAAGGKFPYPAGNSAENNGMQSNGHYAGTASYQGSSIVDPANPAPPAHNPPPPPPALTPAATTPEMATQAGRVNADKNTPWTSSVPSIPKDMSKSDLMGLIGNIVDAIGGGMRAYGGVDSPTRLMQQGKINMQVQAEKAAAQNQANIEYEQKIRLLPVEAQNAIAQARKIGDIKTEQDIATQYGIEKAVQPLKLEQIKEAAKLQSAGIRSPEQAAFSIFGGQ